MGLKATGGLTPLSKILIILVIIGGLGFGIYQLGGPQALQSLMPTESKGEYASIDEDERENVLRVGINIWGGFAGGPYYNEGFKANTDSRFYKDYGFPVEFVVFDDFSQASTALKNNKIDVVWNTIDAFPTYVNSLSNEQPQVFLLVDKSRGGDAIIGRRGINKVNDLKQTKGEAKKKIAVVEMSPSHTFLLNVFKTAGIHENEVELIKVPDAIKAAEMFKNGAVDAAVVWSPDDEDAIKAVPGSKVLMSTETAGEVIMDVMLTTKAYADANPEKLKQFAEGWLKGNAEINMGDVSRIKASKILADGFGVPEDFALGSISKARLTTLGDNINFFGLNASFHGVTGEDLYSQMAKEFTSAGYIKKNEYNQPDVPAFKKIINTSIVQNVKLTGAEHDAEGAAVFAKTTPSEAKAEAVSTKKVTITFNTGMSALSEQSKYVIDTEFGDIAKNFSNAKIRVVGNTDNTGAHDTNVSLSKARAQAVADYLAHQYGFDKNRFIVIGNGPDSPIASNSTEEGRSQNRRTDFELIAK
jgi:NitT/TauT family transport system substrate-binding protein